ncbi:MAG: zinc dependent phospholipase C family protein [Burkholderiales bacterium]
MRNISRWYAWIVPLFLYSGSAHAWGLYTHVYFAQLLLWAVPISGICFQRALRRFPGLVLGGACLPDIVLTAKLCGVAGFAAAHGWPSARRLLVAARSDRERALALGYASHLLVDIIAHHDFVPDFEMR